MLLTCGKDRFYEKMMQEIPGFHRGKCKPENDSRYKYKFADVDCVYCERYKSCGNGICPHITENLDELTHDDDFWSALASAETCQTAQKNTLLMLKESLEVKTA